MSLPVLQARLADRYHIIRELGQGGMALVYLAEDLKHHRQVAIKVLRSEVASAIGGDRFLREIELTAGLQHPHILPLFDSGDADGVLYYVMPYVDGESLRDRLDRDRVLPLDDAFAIASDVASALTWAHSHGVIHRDIKPENILLAGGEALVADFGIALAVSHVRESRMTATGISIGTPAYMSPEQISGDRTIDGRSDVYALACVLYEMLAGHAPFTGDTAQSLITKVLVSPPTPVRSVRHEVPPAADAAILRALAKDPAERFATPREFMDACKVKPAIPVPRYRVGAIVAVVVVLLAAVLWPVWRSAQVARARATIPEIESLANAHRYAEAYAVAIEAERWIGKDSVLVALLESVADIVTVESAPAGARVHLQRVPDSTEIIAASTLIGITPITDYRVARGDYLMRLELDGRVAVERTISSSVSRSELPNNRGRILHFNLALPSVDSVPVDMVMIPGGTYAIVTPDVPPGLSAELQQYFIDRFEVTNDEYQQFVRNGGYANTKFWRTAIDTKRLVDRTGLAAPREWMGQVPPERKGNHPVTGVSWYEADAFCASEGKRLPTFFEWEKAARDGISSPIDVVMPWGSMSAVVRTERRANFGGKGTVPVDSLPFGISAYGVHALAGNAKEWLSNPSGDGYTLAGGSWQDPAYLFSELGALPAETATPAIGFRCARTVNTASGDQGNMALRLDAPPPSYRPVDANTIRTLLTFYRYDKQPANARITDRVETPDWMRERIWIDGVSGDSILAYLYLPKRAAPPFQLLVQVPSSGAFFYESIRISSEADLGAHIKAGRAVLAPVLYAMIERAAPAGWRPPAPASVGFRDLMVRHATELRMAVDYATTRADIDSSRIAYVGQSWGAGSRLVFAGVDDRFKAVVLIGAGIDERVQPTLPEAANFNFAPYIRAPKLVVNGRQDEEHPWLTRGLPLWNLLVEPKELVLIDGVGHHPPPEVRVPPINAFLDKVLGPVEKLR
jgi:dienelactone hydrolase